MQNLYGTSEKTESEYVPADGSIADREGDGNIRE